MFRIKSQFLKAFAILEANTPGEIQGIGLKKVVLTGKHIQTGRIVGLRTFFPDSKSLPFDHDSYRDFPTEYEISNSAVLT